MDNNVYQKVVNFTIKQTLIDEIEFKRSTLNQDLGITGDDAREYLHNFSNEFNVDISNFPFNEFFENEGS